MKLNKCSWQPVCALTPIYHHKAGPHRKTQNEVLLNKKASYTKAFLSINRR